MTIETSTARVSYNISGTGPYTIPFRFLNNDDITVIKSDSDGANPVTMTIGTDYSLTGAGGSGGFLTLVSADRDLVTIINDPDITQAAEYPLAGKFPADSHERALDKLTIIANRLDDKISRSLRLNDSDQISNTELPISEPNKYIGFDGSRVLALLDAPNLTETLAAQAAAEAAADTIDGFENAGARTQGVIYYKNNLVRDSGSTYIVVADPSYTAAATVATDVANGHIVMFAQKGDAPPGGGDVLVANNLSEFTATQATARTNLGIGNAGTKTTGAGSANVPLGSDIFGKQSIWLPASAFIARDSLPPTRGMYEVGVVNVQTWDFDPIAAEAVQAIIQMPKSWNRGNVTAKPLWFHGAGGSAFGVAWEFYLNAMGDSEALTGAWGSAVVVTDTGGTANVLYIGAESGNITPGGAPSSGDLVVLQVNREPSNGGDTLNIDARLLGVMLFYTTEAHNDA
jgi:hypothetical protein